ncbi:DNA modification methylase [Clostridium beijerinckii]|uniref:DNA modification methylase n=1 Tax=Clostridium beijerinckii TaxID=1520 RepID=UPI001494FAB4|nr:DNA modification methylase [Clostridium beijerinckii]NOW86766.1 DNA modification methylase [Clostridium beijerinckii]
MTNKLNVEYMSIETLIPYINNPRKNEKAINMVAGSIKEFGFKNPIIVDKDNIIVAGHTRYEASKKLDLKEVPIIKADDLTEKQIKAFRIADNKTAEFAEWDMNLLAIELEGLDDIFTGFEAVELEDIMGTDEVLEDDFYEEEELEEATVPFSLRGDVWLLGNNRLMCGDSTDAADVQILMDGKFANMVFTDPPYNVAYEGKTKDKLVIENDDMSHDEFYEFLKKVFHNYFNIMAVGAPIYVCHADSEGENFRRAYRESGLKLAECIIWVKNSFVMGRQDYHWRHEPILYGWKEGVAHYFVNDRTQDTVWEIARPQRNAEHPTMKPLDLCARAIKNSSKPKELVVDLFGGSGSTLIAADSLNRFCYSMEYDPKYVDVIVNRYIKTKESSDDVYLIRNGETIKYSELEIEQ